MHFKGMRLLSKIILIVSMIALLISSSYAVDPRNNNNPNNPDFPTNPDLYYATMVLSISSDGHYAVSSNMNNQVILWNLQNHTHKIISNHANIYSAYYIKHSPYFMWQSLPQGTPLLKLGTSAGKPPANKLKLVGEHKLGIVSEENKHYYFYFPSNTPGSIVKKLNPHTINSNYLIHGNFDHSGDNFDFSPYEDHYNGVPDLTARYRFLKVIMDLGYHSGNIVHVQDPSGKEALHFDHFPVYGQAMRANLQDYFSVSYPGSLYKGHGNHERMMMLDNSGFGAKLLNLSLANNKPLISTSGEANSTSPLVTGKNVIFGNMDSNHLYSELNGVTLWNTQTAQPIHKFIGNEVKTFATLSPDAKFLIAGDENTRLYTWSLDNFKRMENWSMGVGKPIAWKDSIVTKFYNKGLKIRPADYKKIVGNQSSYVLAIKFVDKTHYLRINLSFDDHTPPVAILYDVHSPWPITYFHFGNIKPGIYSTIESSAIDSSPSAHILVMAMSGQRGGILVYHYDPKKMTLTRVWAAHLPLPPTAYSKLTNQDRSISFHPVEFIKFIWWAISLLWKSLLALHQMASQNFNV